MNWSDPELRDALVVLVTLYPVVRILRRLGLNPAMAALLLFSLLIPLLGHFLVALYAVSRKWPALPVPPAPKRRVREAA